MSCLAMNDVDRYTTLNREGSLRGMVYFLSFLGSCTLGSGNLTSGKHPSSTFFVVFNSFIKIEFIYPTIHSFKVYKSLVFSVFTELCICHHNQFFVLLKGNSVAIISHSLLPTNLPALINYFPS